MNTGYDVASGTGLDGTGRARLIDVDAENLCAEPCSMSGTPTADQANFLPKSCKL